jgi:hypothetical protein
MECDVEYCPNCDKLLVFEDDSEITVCVCVHCRFSFCNVCRDRVDDYYCLKCDMFNEINPYAYSNFFTSDSEKDDITDFKIKNKDITVKLAVNQITEKIENNSVRCPCCKTFLFRTEQCNALKCCHIEICSFCGEFSDIGTELHDHWSARGIGGCPRFLADTVCSIKVPEFRCIDGLCYSHSMGECKTKDHVVGIFKMEEFKKRQLLFQHLASLLPRIRYILIEKLPDSVKKYLPENDIFDSLDNSSKFKPRSVI